MVQLKTNYTSFIFIIYFFLIFTLTVLFKDIEANFLTMSLLLFSIFNLKNFIKQVDYKFIIVLIPISISSIINLSIDEIIYTYCFFNFWYLKNIKIGVSFYISALIYSLFLYFISLRFLDVNDIRGLIPFLNNHDKIPSYSISLFENLSVTATSFFGLILFIFGTSKKSKLYFFLQLVGLYLVFFGASRLSIILLFYTIVIRYFLNKKSHIILFSILIFIAPVFIIFIPSLISFLPENLLFFIDKGRSKYSIFTDPRVFTAIEYFSLIKKSPIFGLGSLNFKEIFYTKDLAFSELQVLIFTAKFGIISLISYIWFFITRLYNNILINNKNLIIVYFVYLFSMMYYGSFLIAYNFLFLLLISLLYVKK